MKWYKTYNTNTKDRWFINIFIENINKQLDALYRKKRYLSNKNPTNSYDISLIRGIPINKIMGSPAIEQYGRVKYLCPLHKEKLPSFVLYKDTNSWYCFGCCRGGSIIDLVMAVDKCDVGEAIKKLSYYL